MSSRLFQNVREAWSGFTPSFSGMSAYRDAGSFTIYARVVPTRRSARVVDLVVEKCLGSSRRSCPTPELQRARIISRAA